MAEISALMQLTRMLRDGEISQQNYNTLENILRHGDNNISGTEHGYRLPTVVVPGNVQIRQTIIPSELEATSRLMNTPELLEMILLCPPSRDLLIRTHFTCKAFRNAIEESPTIQRQLHRIPDFASKMHRFNRFGRNLPLYTDAKTKRAFESKYSGFLHKPIRIPFDSITPCAKQSASLRKTYVTQPPMQLLLPDHSIRKLSSDTFHHYRPLYQVR